MWICQHYQEITLYIGFHESVFWEQRFVQWVANVISRSKIGDANDMLIKPLKQMNALNDTQYYKKNMYS